MMRWLARLALRLYPLAFQRRYGEEMRDLLEQTPPRVLTVIDLLRGALMAHLRPMCGLADRIDPADRLRLSASGVLICWVVFAAAGFGFYKTTEDGPYRAAGLAHPLLADAHLAVQAVALVACAAVLLGAFPLVVSAMAAARHQSSLRRPIALALSPLVLFAGLTGVLIVAAHARVSGHPTVAFEIAFVLWGLAGLGCGIACVLASRAGLFALALPPSRLVVALAGGTVVTIAMGAMASATAVYAIALSVDASRLSGTPNGPFQAMSTGASLVVQLIVMLVAGALAVTTTRRGWQAARQLQATASA